MINDSKILIVDDTVDTVELLRKRLRAEGYETSEAFDGEECLKLVGAYGPDLVILDVMMPGIDGYEVCRRLKKSEETRYIPVLMLTAKGDVEDKVRGLDLGADDYLAKPFEYKELSARVRSLLSMKKARAQLVEEEKIEALESMMDEVAHEIRNPLVSIGGFARRVHDSLPEGNPNRKYMEMIIEEVVKLERMIKQIVEIQALAVSYFEPLDVRDVVSQALADFERECEDRAVDVETDFAEDLPAISGDREQLRKAFGNVIENALEAMTGEARLLRIATAARDGCVEVIIADTGKGISRDKLKNIFEPLFTSKIYGPGLGLTFTHTIVQEHRGTISVVSEPGKGTTFTISLPVKRRT